MSYWKFLSERLFDSLEKRLIGALSLIVILTGSLQIISQKEAFSLRGESEALITASAVAENADQFAEAVRKLRMASNRGLVASDPAMTSDVLTDAAIAIGDQLEKLRSGGMALYDLPETSTLFANLDQHVSAILEVGRRGAPFKELVERIEARNNAMESLADKIVAKAHSDREAAQNRLIASI